MITAFAASIDGINPDIKTIMPHPRGAMVNWLALNGYLIADGISDEAIKMLFCKVSHKLLEDDFNLNILEVQITVVGEADISGVISDD